MTSPDFLRSFLPTSTPIRKEHCGEESGYLSSTSTPIGESHEEESDYFGSNRKNHRFQHSTFTDLSPVKELSPLHKDVSRTEHDDSDNFSFCFSLCFSPPSKKTYQSRDSVNFPEQAHGNTFDCSPSCGKYQLRNTVNFTKRAHSNKVNFIENLEMRNCGLIISKIFSNLSDKDLCNVSFVSQRWRNAVLNDRKASIRRNEFLKHRKDIATGPNKENGCPREPNFTSPRKDALNNICNLLPSKVSVQPLIASFVEEAENWKGERKIIVCRKLDLELSESWKNEPKIIVCSKQSKKNLRRL